jgi:hypothetical protein
MRTFTSYVSKYESHVGKISMGSLPRDQQDELIRLIFDPDGDHQAYVMKHDVEHSAANALWTIVVSIGMYLERRHVIKDFDARTARDWDWIINFLAPTNLWLRLEEAFPPFDGCHVATEYDWSELDRFSSSDAISELDSDDLREDLLEVLSVPSPPADGVLMRLPYQTYLSEWESGRLCSFVDRGMAVQAYRLSNSVWTRLLPSTFLISLLAFIPVMIFISFWLGLGILALSILARKALTSKSVEWVRKDALANRERYRWYSSRRMIWARRM